MSLDSGIQRRRRALAGLLGLACLAGAGCRREAGPPYSAVESVKTMRLEPGFRIEPFVTEPAVTSPVAIDFDEHGRLFVVEMPGYPLDTRPTGRVKLLEDRDRDGRYERAAVFADGLVLPTGVMRWKRGVLVTAAPDVLYFEDRDGDGRAETRRVVLTGFAFTNPQHTVNGPVFGLDNWIYLAHEGPAGAVVFKEKFGDRGSGIRFPDEPGAPPLDAGRRGVRFKPDLRALETLAGHSQFGHAFDEWGRYFTLDNSNHARHEVIAARYLRRNPDLLLATAMQDASDHGAAAVVYPITRRPQFEMLTEPGQFTSACSLTFWPGGDSPETGRSSFVAEPVHNLVHRDLWSPAGATFVARRASEEVEFLAAEDPWFRPVNFAAGPDGALYLVDYYRPVIEHPEWGASHRHHDSPELYRGRDRGRIYRITGAVPAPPRPDRLPDEATVEELVAMLGNPNLWWRRTAQRLLLDRRPEEAPALLSRVARESPSPLARLHALWTLEGLGRLEPALVARALGDAEPGVRENAVRLSEAFLPGDAALAERLAALAADPDARVRFQLLCTLGSLDSPRARAAQERLLLEGIEDEWVQAAALSASSGRAAAYFERATAPGAGPRDRMTPGRAAFFRQAASVIGARRRPAEVARLIATVAAARGSDSDWWRAASLEGLARGLRGTRADASTLAASRERLLALFEGPSAAVRHASLELLGTAGLPESASARAAVERSADRATDRAADPEARADAIGLLVVAGRLSSPPGPPIVTGGDPHLALLRGLVDPREPEAVQAAAIQALGRARDVEVGALLVERWRSFTPSLRNEAARALLRDPARTRLLLAAVEDGRIPAWTLGFRPKRDLLMNDDPDVRAKAHALLEEKPGEREQIVRRYEGALDGPADAARGAQVFRDACAKCHRFREEGAEVGPDLGTVRNRPATLLLKDILVPSLSIAPGYESYVVERASGAPEEGVLAGQTPTAVVLRRERGQEVVIPRRDVQRMYVSTLSAMPADLEQQVSERQMADLIQYLRQAPR